MSRATKALAAGAGLAAAAAAVVARRPRSPTSGGRGGGAQRVGVVTTTILRPVDEVTRAWAAEAEGEGQDRAGDRPVGVDFAAAPGDRGAEVRARLGPDASPDRRGQAARVPVRAGRASPRGHAGDGQGEGDGLLVRRRGETPVQRQRDRLRRFKAVLECGEVVTTEGQPSGRGPVQEAVTRAVSRRLRAWSGQ